MHDEELVSVKLGKKNDSSKFILARYTYTIYIIRLNSIQNMAILCSLSSLKGTHSHCKWIIIFVNGYSTELSAHGCDYPTNPSHSPIYLFLLCLHATSVHRLTPEISKINSSSTKVQLIHKFEIGFGFGFRFEFWIHICYSKCTK